MKPLFDVQHLAYLFHHLTCEVCALVRFNLDWCSPEWEDLVRYYSCHCVCTVIAGGNRFDSGPMKSNWSNSQGPLGGSGLHSFVRPG